MGFACEKEGLCLETIKNMTYYLSKLKKEASTIKNTFKTYDLEHKIQQAYQLNLRVSYNIHRANFFSMPKSIIDTRYGSLGCCGPYAVADHIHAHDKPLNGYDILFYSFYSYNILFEKKNLRHLMDTKLQ